MRRIKMQESHPGEITCVRFAIIWRFRWISIPKFQTFIFYFQLSERLNRYSKMLKYIFHDLQSSITKQSFKEIGVFSFFTIQNYISYFTILDTFSKILLFLVYSMRIASSWTSSAFSVQILKSVNSPDFSIHIYRF